MALTTIDLLVLALKQTPSYVKVISTGAQSSGTWFNPWAISGSVVGAVASSGVNGNTLTSATAGAIPFVDPSSGLTYLVQANLDVTFGGGAIYLYDRLWHNSGLSPTTVGAQAMTPVAIPSRCPVLTDPTGRTFDALGAGVEAWLDVTTVMGAGTLVPSISYTNEAGTAGRAATQQGWVTAGSANRSFPFDRVAGDKGVRSIESYNNLATQTSGAFSLVLRRRLATIPQVSDRAVQPLDWGALGAVIPNGACLEVLVQSSVTNAVGIAGSITLAQG